MRTLTRTIVGVEYRALRTPLALVDGALAHLPERSRVRQVVHAGITRLDGLAAAVLAPPQEQPSAQEQAPQARARTGAALSEQAPEHVEELAEEQEQIVEVILSEEEERKHVGELAEADEQTKHDLAELRAKHKVLELEEERRMREADA